MKNIIKNLVKVANYLDTEAMFEESNTITNIAVKLAESMNDIDDMDDMDDEDLDLDDSDMDDEDLDMDDEDLDSEDDEEDNDNIQELMDLLEELGVSEKEKLEILEMVKKDTDDVEEYGYEAPSAEDKDLLVDESLLMEDNSSDDSSAMDDMNFDEEQSAADDAMISDDGYDDVRSLLKDDPELLAWYESLGSE